MGLLLGAAILVLPVLLVSAALVRASLLRVPEGHRGELLGRPGVLEPGWSWRWFGRWRLRLVDLRPREIVSRDPLIAADDLMTTARLRLVARPHEIPGAPTLPYSLSDEDLAVLYGVAIAYLRHAASETPAQQLVAEQRSLGARLESFVGGAPVSAVTTVELALEVGYDSDHLPRRRTTVLETT